MDRIVRKFDCLGSTIYRIVERSSSLAPWLVYLPCVDYDRKEDAELKIKEIEDDDFLGSE